MLENSLTYHNKGLTNLKKSASQLTDDHQVLKPAQAGLVKFGLKNVII
jgi:hypothetical protein